MNSHPLHRISHYGYQALIGAQATAFVLTVLSLFIILLGRRQLDMATRCAPQRAPDQRETHLVVLSGVSTTSASFVDDLGREILPPAASGVVAHAAQASR